jgi:hypothetical protein
MKNTNTLGLLCLCLVLSSCANTDWTRNVYEGIRQTQKVNVPPSAPRTSSAGLPNYDEYQAERGALQSEKK